jgi:hypothetical protein
MNIFRVAFRMERLVPNSMTGGFDNAYLSNLTAVCCAYLPKSEQPDADLVADGQSHH